MNKHERRQIADIIELLNKGQTEQAVAWLRRFTGKPPQNAPDRSGLAPEAQKALGHGYDFVAYCDGSCWPNPGGVAKLGVLIQNREGAEVYRNTKDVCSGPKATNNAAEAAAFGHALEILHDLAKPGQTALIQGDSQMTVFHLTGNWRIKHGHYRRWALDAQEWLRVVRSNGIKVAFKWIPRELNVDADRISR